MIQIFLRNSFFNPSCDAIVWTGMFSTSDEQQTIYTINISLSHYVLCVHTLKIECIHVISGFDYWIFKKQNMPHISFLNKGIYFLMDSQQKGIKIMSTILFKMKQPVFWWINTADVSKNNSISPVTFIEFKMKIFIKWIWVMSNLFQSVIILFFSFVFRVQLFWLDVLYSLSAVQTMCYWINMRLIVGWILVAACDLLLCLYLGDM